MRIALTGGSGYIGTHILVELLDAGHDVLAFDNFINSSPSALNAVQKLAKKPFEFVEADIANTSVIQKKLSSFQADAVIHLAGLKAVGESEQMPLTYYENNVAATVSLLRAMDGAGCQSIVFSSSATVYGVPRYLPLDEVHPLAPVNVYGRTKMFVEYMLRDWAATDLQKSVVLLRYFNPIGAHVSGQIGENPNGVPNNLMPYVTQVAVGRRERLKIFGDDYDTPDGTGIRDYIHVSDLALGHIAACEHASRHQGVDSFNLGTGQGYSVHEIRNCFEQITGKAVPYDIVPRRAGDIAHSYASVSKAHSVLGWSAQRGLADMCADSWRWQSQNPEGFSD